MPGEARVLESIAVGEPVDGFSISRDGASLAITLSNRYGHADRYLFGRRDAAKLARAIVSFYKMRVGPL